MHPSPLKGKWDIIRSTYVEAKGFGLTVRFSRLWLCLTADELLFYKDSTYSPSKTNVVLSCNSIAYVEQDRPDTLRVSTTCGDVCLRFKTVDDMNAWETELNSILKPVVCIGENVIHAHQLHQSLHTGTSYGHIEHPYNMRNNSPNELEIFDEVTSLRGPSEPGTRRKSLNSLRSSDTATIVTGVSQAGSRHSRQYSLLSGSTRVSESPYWKSLRITDQLTESWPDLSEILTAVEDEFAAHIDDVQRPPSPLDPDLVFDSGRIYFSVSEAPNPRDAECVFFDLTGQITKLGNYPVATGGYADIWCGEWDAGDGPKNVAIKVIRSFTNDNSKTDDKIKRRLAQELDIWTKLRHRNIIPLFGVVYDLGRHASMVSPWMHRGNAVKYFEELDTQTTVQIRLKALCEVACGMEYLHCFHPPVIHGDLKASNVLINDDGEAVLADFGISAVIEEATGSCRLTSSSFAGSVRWMAFELIRLTDDTVPRLTTYSDIWSYGSTVLEILSGKAPYHHRKNDIQVLHEILRGIKPRKTDGISDEIWDLIQTCWRDDPASRPSVSAIRQTMDKIYRRSKRMAMELVLDINV